MEFFILIWVIIGVYLFYFGMTDPELKKYYSKDLLLMASFFVFLFWPFLIIHELFFGNKD